jgi:hypothetical protein
MHRVSRVLCITFFLCGLIASRAWGLAQTIGAPEAKNHVGETAIVCVKFMSTRFATSSRCQPTFLNLATPYLRQIFTVVIWGSDRSKFDRPERSRIGINASVSQEKSGRFAACRRWPLTIPARSGCSLEVASDKGLKEASCDGLKWSWTL